MEPRPQPAATSKTATKQPPSQPTTTEAPATATIDNIASRGSYVIYAATKPQARPTGTAATKSSSTAATNETKMATSLPVKQPDVDHRRSSRPRGFFSRATTMVGIRLPAAESNRLREDKERKFNWKRWGPYLSERQWATVREDYSPDGSW